MKTARLLLILAWAGLSACSNMYYERKDAITIGNGDSIEANKVLQIADPWPKGSQNTKIPMDPVKAAQAMYKYRCGGSAGSTGGFKSQGDTGGSMPSMGGMTATPEASGGYC
jgi:hypothetical protein